MNWLTKSVLPKIKAFVNNKEVKENLWIKSIKLEILEHIYLIMDQEHLEHQSLRQ